MVEIVACLMRKYFLVLLSPLFLLFFSCEKQIPDQVIPFAFVNEDIKLTNLQYIDLQNIGGFVYYEAGYKGIIIYHEGNGIYRAFERACSYDPRASCNPVAVDESSLFLKHECCNSSFNFNGNPMSGPAAANLLQYAVFVDGGYLKIRNE
jgi:hypothetical protein